MNTLDELLDEEYNTLDELLDSKEFKKQMKNLITFHKCNRKVTIVIPYPTLVVTQKNNLKKGLTSSAPSVILGL